jgi:hypothetical protein
MFFGMTNSPATFQSIMDWKVAGELVMPKNMTVGL